VRFCLEETRRLFCLWDCHRPGVNESRQVVRIVESDEDLLRTIEATPGAVGILDVYAINSSVKVLRVDGKLPFDVGYALKGN